MTAFLDKKKTLTPLCLEVLCYHGTETPTQTPKSLKEIGSFLCRRCGLALFRARHQFITECGWLAFDKAITPFVKIQKDKDGIRDEIVCERCDGHLGHVFYGEQLTENNTRYCVNDIALDWVSDETVMDTEEAIVAGGCFWGVEYYLKQITGVLNTESGYTGGHLLYPRYEQVSKGHTGHFEAVRVLYNTGKTDYKTIIKRFFEIHDPTQRSGQGPDLGSQYQSAIFCHDHTQENIVKELITLLKKRGYDVVTSVEQGQIFWKAEEWHQRYYEKHHAQPYCHYPTPRFG